MSDLRQGIVHVIGPEQGATLPGMTVVCGDSHTSTHGAFQSMVSASRWLCSLAPESKLFMVNLRSFSGYGSGRMMPSMIGAGRVMSNDRPPLSLTCW